MNLMFCGDKNIVDGVIIALLSITNHTEEPLSVYILTMAFEQNGKSCEPVPESFAEFMNKILKDKNSESFVRVIDASGEFRQCIPQKNLETRFTPGCMLRLYADLIPELPDKILYLDNDIICRRDFSGFYHTDLEGAELAGVLDYYGSWFFRRNILHRDYMNSGVLLLNLEEIRRTGLFEKCRERCRDKKMFMPDQSAINKLAKVKIKADRCYNEQRKLKSDTVFQHFTTSFRFFPYIHTVSVKPWHIDKVHSTLKIYEYDRLFEQYEEVRTAYTREKEISR